MSSMATGDEPVTLIDIHTHVLAEFDDGPVSLDEAVDMVAQAQRDGIGKLFATPHSAHLIGKSYGEPQIRAAVSELQRELDARMIGVEVLPGIEVHIAPDLEQEIKAGRAFTLAGSRYLLLELPFSMYPLYTEQVIADLRIRGIVSILAHPERLEYFQRDPNLLRKLLKYGALIQLTADSVLGNFGPRIQAFSQIVLEHGWAHFLASDAHDNRYRVPVLSQAQDAAAAMMGEEAARALVVDHPLAVIANSEIVAEEPQRYVTRRRWFW